MSKPLPEKLRASVSNSSGCEGRLPSWMSSTGFTKPVPNIIAQVRFTVDLAKYGLLASVSHLANAGR